MKNSAINTTKNPEHKMCEFCGTFTKRPDGCININHFMNSKHKGKKG